MRDQRRERGVAGGFLELRELDVPRAGQSGKRRSGRRRADGFSNRIVLPIGIDAHPIQEGDIPVPYLRKTGFETAGGLFAAYSADGVRWTMRRGWLAVMILRDGSTLHGYNERERRWVLWQRPAFIRGIRMIGSATHHPPEISRALRIRFSLERAHLYSFSC